MSYTPGPWCYVPRLSGSENHRGFRVGKDGGFALCEIVPVDVDGAEGEANARLIAAAPELADALRQMLRTHPSLNAYTQIIREQPLSALENAGVKL